MSVALPAIPKEAIITPRLVDFGAMLTPPLGGAGQYVGRLGARYALDVQLPMLDDASARAWIAAQLKARAESTTLTFAWPQTGGANLGSPVVDGAGQAGATLSIKGMTASVAIPQLLFLSFISGGRHYLHAVTTAGAASGAGKATLAIAPMLRVSPADNLAIETVAPVAEGFIVGAAVAWSVERLKRMNTSFTLQENE